MAEPGLALCSMATSPSASAAGSFALSVQTFERGRHLFLGADAEGAAAVRAAWTLPLAQLHVVDVPAQFHNRDRERLTRYGKWTEFQMLKADVLRRALSAGQMSIAPCEAAAGADDVRGSSGQFGRTPAHCAPPSRIRRRAPTWASPRSTSTSRSTASRAGSPRR